MSRELLQQALQHLVDLADDLRRIPSDIAQTIAALEAELAKPEQEPVAWLHPDKKVDVVVPTSLAWFDKPIPLYTSAKPEQENEAYSYAKRLAEFIWKEHYKEESPDWTPLPDVLGVLTQIDNMTCGLEKSKPEMPTKIFGPNLEQILNAAGFYRHEMIQIKDGQLSYIKKPWQGLTDDEINDFDKKLRDNGDYCSLHFAWGMSAKRKENNT